MYCELIKVDDRYRRCKICKVLLRDERPIEDIKRPCPAKREGIKNTEQEKIEGPGLIQRAINFGGAVVKHVADGMKRRTDEEIKEIFQQKCLPCKFYKEGKCMHAKCGCSISSEPEVINKIAWESEHCPIGNW